MAGISTLYISQPGTSVRKQDERLLLRRGKQVVGDVPMLNLRRVIVIGHGIEVSSEAELALVERKIDLYYFSRSLRFKARMIGDVSNNAALRFAQARYVDNPARQLVLAKVIVFGKLDNQRRTLAGHDAAKVIGKLGQMMQRLEAATDLDSLRGYEGQGAALYFRSLRERLGQLAVEWGFERRAYYPPPDPFNALLSYGYSLLTREMLAATHIVGLDPHLGFFHAIDFGRPSLVLDLIEEFRPVVVDRLVMGLVEQKILQLSDFEQIASSEGAASWHLKNAARQQLLQHYEQHVSSYVYYEPEKRNQTLRQVLELQARQIAHLMQGQTDSYQPVRL